MKADPTQRAGWSVELGDGTVLVLRAPEAADAPALRAAVLDTIDDLTRWFDWCHADWSPAECEELIATWAAEREAGRSDSFVILDERGQVAGAVWISRLDWQHRFANLGYWVRRTHAGRGIATAAAASLAQYGFAHLGLTRLEIVVDVDNLASQRVAAKLGARREGVLRWRLVHHGQPHDAVMYSLVNRPGLDGRAEKQR